MAIIHEATNEVICKIVYHGTGKCGKTTNLLYLDKSLPAARKGRFVTLETPTERTLFFDYLPVRMQAQGATFRFLLFATPGQEYYDASRKLVFKGADAIVFVADSSRERMQENDEALGLLKRNLTELGQSADAIPTVIQYNKRDLRDAVPIEDAERRLNPGRRLPFPAVARTGEGVYDTFLTAAKMALTRLRMPGSEAAMGPLFKTLVVNADDEERFKKLLARLVADAEASGALLVDESSGVLALEGAVPYDALESLGALLACNFTAAQELSTMLAGQGFAGLTQRGTTWLLRAGRVDARRFVVLVASRRADRQKMRAALTAFRGPLAAALQMVDTVSPNRLASFGELLASVTALDVAGLTSAA